MEKRAAITKGILSAALLFGVALATIWLIRRSPPATGHRSLSTANAYAGLDSGYDAIGLAQSLNNPQVSGFKFQVSTEGWVRLRGIDLSKVPETRDALLQLRANGIKTCVFLRWPAATDWKRKYLPEDLRESYEHGRKLGATYGDLVDAWEVDNEPDLGFVPESAERYTAFLKATYLGLKAGAREQRSDVGRQTSDVSQQRAPLVIMGSLGLPPGQWLERFAANDGFAYTDGFNYHYYGYADDFTGVYQQHETAVKDLTTDYTENTDKNTSAISATSVLKKDLPIFMTEIGYGMLGKQARDTKEGRLRQWRWFKSVGEQIATLRPEAPMAFYLRPYLEYDTSEYGLTVPAKQETEVGGPMTDDGRRKTEEWTAGGIKYRAEDFGVEKSEPWMARIGTNIGGNQVTPALAQWLAARNPSGLRSQVSGFSAGASRPWAITTPAPSPIVLDFLPGEGLSHVKRYNGLFVIGKSPEVGRVIPNAPPTPQEPAKPLPPTTPPSAVSPPLSEKPRSEELILQVRTQNGNLYEVYPTRQATPDWQRFLEPGDNFTMSFYGRAVLPWRFKDNKPASLVIVMYPKQLPATYEFRRPLLIRFGAEVGRVIPNAPKTPEHGGLGIIRPTTDPETQHRYGSGRIILYNFSDKPVTGRLALPEAVGRVIPNAPGINESIVLQPHERREIPVSAKVPWVRYERIEVPITFVPEDATIPPARYLTALIPDIGGLPASLVSSLLPQEVGRVDSSAEASREGRIPNAPSNREIALRRPRVSEEVPMVEQRAESKKPSAQRNASDSLSSSRHALTAFVQPGAQVALTSDGFAITVSARLPGKPQRIEVEIPWPDGLAFAEDEFLSVEFRLRP